jgi:hypothetical protein
MKKFLLSIAVFLCAWEISAQDTLPDFSIISRGNRVILSWKNPYPVVKQINIQRSPDSTRNFTTIMSIPDPKLPENGFVDAKPVNNKMFYRLFILLDSGKYVFTHSKRPDTTGVLLTSETSGNDKLQLADDLTKEEITNLQTKIEKTPEPEKKFLIIRNDSLIAQIAEKDFKKFRDSVVRKTPDTLLFASLDSVIIKPFKPKVVYKPSQYVYTMPDGNVAVRLQDATTSHYRLVFFDDKENRLFEIKKLKENVLSIDKTSFLHGGWYFFELYKDDQLFEKHKLYIPPN